ncbi:MAG: enoyl-CoA hydratase/isomerase family protein [Acidobacteria bacterium]|nr:enoyl-CoA hydratase/isomerase family protein [Acidobacteriota bacterium]
MMTAAGREFERLSLTLEGQVAHITLDHPPLNVIDLRMMTELSSALAQIATQPQILVIILWGAGGSFSAGVDVAAHAPGNVAAMLTTFHAVIRGLIGSDKLSIAAVHGHCLGGGAELAMVCDLVYTTADACWGFPEIQLGCFPPVAATALSTLVGHKRAAELILTGRTFSGLDARNLGLANEALPIEELRQKTLEAASRFAELSPIGLSLAKKAIFFWHGLEFDKGLQRAEKIYLTELLKTEDAREGIRAFLDKRKPRWVGR